jgi:hypothetical protein
MNQLQRSKIINILSGRIVHLLNRCVLRIFYYDARIRLILNISNTQNILIIILKMHEKTKD